MSNMFDVCKYGQLVLTDQEWKGNELVNYGTCTYPASNKQYEVMWIMSPGRQPDVLYSQLKHIGASNTSQGICKGGNLTVEDTITLGNETVSSGSCTYPDGRQYDVSWSTMLGRQPEVYYSPKPVGGNHHRFLGGLHKPFRG